ncbi:MAG: hypothetical protein ACR652_17590 [Methylocystis sp.]|uniref:hypothetical protein n=1 Tax=Methylocystis sp. TaxID=1911079 RepID=UPI003DA2AFD5
MAQISPLHRGARAFNDNRATGNWTPHRHRPISGPPWWLDMACKAFILAMAVVSVALWIAF